MFAKSLASVPSDVVACWILALISVALLWVMGGRGPKGQLAAQLNSLTPQAWAFLILIIGVIAALLFNRAGIAVDIAAGIIGAGINMFTSQRAKDAPALTPPSPQLNPHTGGGPEEPAKEQPL